MYFIFSFSSSSFFFVKKNNNNKWWLHTTYPNRRGSLKSTPKISLFFERPNFSWSLTRGKTKKKKLPPTTLWCIIKNNNNKKIKIIKNKNYSMRERLFLLVFILFSSKWQDSRQFIFLIQIFSPFSPKLQDS